MLCVRPALTHPNVTLRTHAQVTLLEPDSSGRSVKRVVVERRGAEEAYGADIVVVSCGAVNSAALLLRSTSDRHPNGLARLLRARRATLHGAPELGGDRDLPDAKRHQVPEDARPK